MKILFFHPNMPGQYKHLARHYGKDPKAQVVFMTKPKPNVNIPGVTKIEFNVKRDASPEGHRYLIPLERGVLSSQEVWRHCNKLKQAGFVPDVIVGHFGWGDGMYIKDIFPDSPILSFMEFYYNSKGADLDFLEDSASTSDDKARTRTKNGIHLFNLTYSDWGICPTFFQLIQHPKIFHPKISVLHDGVDTDIAKPGIGNTLTIGKKNVTLDPKDEVITYISRNFEPYRGFPTFMRAAEMIMKRRPNCHIIMVGQDGVSYGKKHESGKSWREVMMKEVNLDMSRFHFLGYLPYEEMIKVMQISSAHIYLTVPFVLSWSMLEAMSCGALLIGSNTDPVKEVVEHEKNGLLVDFFSPEEVANAVDRVLNHKDRMQDLRTAARQTIMERYALNKLMPMHLSLIDDVMNKRFPPPTHLEIQKMHLGAPVLENVA